ncbi:hypothetical protein AGOR_G00095810 [Albula goreensis]|uniref:Uncharacterized protein n=1 Tax=Albula goreensis TaxID=1534307 RepID=A0A8T3DGC9_9TELE|nr:hypothetical protein AGOR_G00095810 [Albula goreensis]
MFNNWERQAAECLTNAEHMREVRQKIDLEHQERLRRREQERAEAEVRRETRLRQLPTPTPPVFNKYRARTYDRPWAQITHVTKTVWDLLPSLIHFWLHGWIKDRAFDKQKLCVQASCHHTQSPDHETGPGSHWQDTAESSCNCFTAQ